MKPRKPIRKRSDRGKVEDRIYKVLREILKTERGDCCQICGREANNIGLSHLHTKGGQPKLKFNRRNILLMCWRPCHEIYHHLPDMDIRYMQVKRRILEICGATIYYDLMVEAVQEPKHSMTYLTTLLLALREELKQLRG